MNKTMDIFEKRFWERVKKTDDCWEWENGKDRNGYGLFWDGVKTMGAHRFSYEIVYGKIPEGLDVLHKCDNPSCVHPKHLLLGTHTDNMRDMISKGRSNYVRYEKHPLSKLTMKQVKEIRKKYKFRQFFQRTLAEIFNVDRTTISDIIRNKTWR